MCDATAASKVSLDKITTYGTLVVTKYMKEQEEMAEYKAAEARGETVVEPSLVETVRAREDEYIVIVSVMLLV